MNKILSHIQKNDVTILRIIHCKAKCSFLDKFMTLITYIGSTTFGISFCIISLILTLSSKSNFGIEVTFSMILSTLLSNIIKINVNRLRPYVKFDNLNAKKIGVDKYSFPSGHTTSAFTMSVMLSLFFPSLSWIFITLSTLVGISRIYLGVHYPTDTIFGTILGSLCSIIIYIFI